MEGGLDLGDWYNVCQASLAVFTPVVPVLSCPEINYIVSALRDYPIYGNHPYTSHRTTPVFPSNLQNLHSQKIGGHFFRLGEVWVYTGKDESISEKVTSPSLTTSRASRYS